jgi:hypothetical protein
VPALGDLRVWATPSVLTYRRTMSSETQSRLGNAATIAAPPRVSPFAATIATAATAAVATSPPSPGDLDPAKERYRVVALLGEGGMGRVFEVVDEQFGRNVALKELLADARGTDIEGRFVVEAVVTANLEHPGIVPVYERGRRDDGTLYYTMRRVRGRSLDDAIASATSMRERLALLPTIIGVAQTLAFAHEHGVIHRDIKPANVYVGPRGEAFVLDWGIAKVRGVDDRRTDAPAIPVSTGKTQAGAVFGTPSYMAPEQARGEVSAIDERTDVFCLGALLHVVLSGRAPYEGASAADVLSKAQVADVQSIDAVAPDAPLALRQIVKRALARDPNERFLSAGDLADALRNASSDALLAPSKPVAIASRGIELTAMTLAVALLGYGILQLQFRELGFGAWFAVAFAAFGLTLSFVEWREKGRPMLANLTFAFAVSTFFLALVAATLGEIQVLRVAENALPDEARWRDFVTTGTRETIGNIALGGELAVLQLVLWAVVRRSVLRARRDPAAGATSPQSTR